MSYPEHSRSIPQLHAAASVLTSAGWSVCLTRPRLAKFLACHKTAAEASAAFVTAVNIV